VKSYTVRLRPAAARHLTRIEGRIAEEATSEIAERYVEAILKRCHSLEWFPHRGIPRDDLRPGLRTLLFKGTVVIVFAVEDSEVAVLGVGWRGQDLARILVEGSERRKW
jgi:plasmid stabilization system protein ParE